jgi:replicative DNA helicase
MEQNLSDLGIRPISVVAQETIDYIKGRREHNITSLRTRWKKFNSQCMGGIEPNTVYTITGISGTGKSSFANLIETDLIDLNQNEDIIILSFSLEMVGFRQIGRTLSNKLEKATSELYSAEKDLDDQTFARVVTVANQLKKYPIYFVDNPGTSKQVEEIIMWFYNKYVKGTNKHFVIMYDHALLTKREGSVLETISNLLQVFIQVKKLPYTSVILLTQMNRNIESPERINNPSAHYPMRSDLSSSDAVFQGSDYVLALHRPELLGIQEYGPSKLPTQNKVYMHILKNRDAGKPCILRFENQLMHNNLVEC